MEIDQATDMKKYATKMKKWDPILNQWVISGYAIIEKSYSKF